MIFQQNYNDLKTLAMTEGMSLFGTADITSIKEKFHIPQNVVSMFKHGISIGFRLSNAVLKTIENCPNQLYYFHYQRVNILLDQTSLKITSWIQNKGFEAMPIPASQVIDWNNQLGILSHIEVAKLAGLGWHGKNNLLVNKNFGSQVRYATILTDLPISIDTPVDEDCGSCQACINVCPANAISENAFNREACGLKLKEFMKTAKIGQMICGVCVNICSGKK